ncbi:MAG TPA: helix-turn-helix transcriptional regulator [Solirubrobacterales bacterium]|jgi:DNA-binding CsgD family transcriptional regulator|nr:helix-turn-helix transcriptional regulator [Solirubrobacterales bacterium]
MDSEEARLLHLIGEVHGLLELEEFRHGLVLALKDAIPSDWVSINDVGPEPGQVWVLAEPEMPREAHEKFGRYMHQNPLIAYMTDGHRRGAALRLSDLTTPREFHSLDLYREVYAPIGLEYQIAFTLPREPPYLLGVALSRRHEDFDDDERDLLNRARPFLIQSYRNAVTFDTLRRGAGPDSLCGPLIEAGLTPREAEVVNLLAHGCSNADLAARLGMRTRTAEKHAQNAFTKLDVHDRSEAAGRAWELAGIAGE